MKQLTKEQYDFLKKYEKHLRRGFYGNYAYGLFQKDFNELLKIYKEVGGNERIQYNCNVCVLRLTKSLGKLYFEYKPEVKKPEVKKPEVMKPEVIEPKVSEPVENEVVEEKVEKVDKPKTKKKRKKKEDK